MILKWYYIHLIYFLNEENDSASADNKKNSKNSEKNVTTENENFNQESASSLQSRLSILIKISMKQNVQNQKNVESWNFLDLNSDYSADQENQNFE